MELQEVVRTKLQEIESMENKHEEMSHEIHSMNNLKHKLNEHIIYLQNEIRKRDELLEQQNSDFGDSNFELLDYEESMQPPEEDQYDELDRVPSNTNLNNMPPNITPREEEESSLRGGWSRSHIGGVKQVSHRAEDEIGGMSSPGGQQPASKMKKKFERKKTSVNIMQGQLEEMRGQLKKQIEEKLRLERRVHMLEG